MNRIRTLHVFMVCAAWLVVTWMHEAPRIVEAQAQAEIARELRRALHERPSLEILPGEYPHTKGAKGAERKL